MGRQALHASTRRLGDQQEMLPVQDLSVASEVQAVAALRDQSSQLALKRDAAFPGMVTATIRYLCVPSCERRRDSST